MSQITTRIITSIRELDQIRDEWNSLIASCGENSTIYLTHEWVAIRWRHFGNNCRLNIVVIKKDGDTIGIFPLMRKNYGFWSIKKEILETIGAVNCNNVGLFRNEESQEAMDALLKYIDNEIAKKNTFVKLELVPEDAVFYKVFQKIIPIFSNNLIYQETNETLAPYVPIRTRWSEYYRTLTPNRRRALHRIIKKMEAGHQVRYSRLREDSLDMGLSKLFEIHRKRWQAINMRSLFSDPKACRFYRDIAFSFSKNDWLHFSSLSVDGEIASIIFAFTYKDKFYAAKSARDLRFADSEIGHLHQLYLLQEAFDYNLKEFDFLQGDEAYKYHWTNQSRRYIKILIASRNHTGKLYIIYMRVFLRFVQFANNKRNIKELIALFRYDRKNRKLKENFAHRLQKKSPEKRK